MNEQRSGANFKIIRKSRKFILHRYFKTKLTLLRTYLPISVLHCCNTTTSYDMKFICHLLKHTFVYFNIKARKFYLSRWPYDSEVKF